MPKPLQEMSLEKLWQLFPIVLMPHDERWGQWYADEEALLRMLVPDAARISHVGSTAVEGIMSKPIVDILVELPEACDLLSVAASLEDGGYIIMSVGSRRISLNKGYAPTGFAERVFHVHLRCPGDADELYFRDYLRTHPEVARDYEELKLSLWRKFEHDRDAYTDAKSEFVKRHTEAAKAEFDAVDRLTGDGANVNLKPRGKVDVWTVPRQPVQNAMGVQGKRGETWSSTMS